jgi:hypothetical protein
MYPVKTSSVVVLWATSVFKWNSSAIEQDRYHIDSYVFKSSEMQGRRNRFMSVMLHRQSNHHFEENAWPVIMVVCNTNPFKHVCCSFPDTEPQRFHRGGWPFYSIVHLTRAHQTLTKKVQCILRNHIVCTSGCFGSRSHLCAKLPDKLSWELSPILPRNSWHFIQYILKDFYLLSFPSHRLSATSLLTCIVFCTRWTTDVHRSCYIFDFFLKSSSALEIHDRFVKRTQSIAYTNFFVRRWSSTPAQTFRWRSLHHVR